jgi:hypothetical protein
MQRAPTSRKELKTHQNDRFSYSRMQNNTQLRPCLPRYRANRDAHLLIPPLRRTNAANGSELGLYSSAYRITRDHFDRVRLSTF